MENRPILLTLQEYLDAVNFTKISRKDQVAYLMYYVTYIARLRGDMTAPVIADRINDQILIENKKYGRSIDNTTVGEIEEALVGNPDYFQPSPSSDKSQCDRRNQPQAAYVLSKSMVDKLTPEFDTDMAGVKRQMRRKGRVEWLFWGILLCCLFTVALSLRDNRNIAKGLPWPEYVEYSQLNDADYDRQCLYILYHITEVTHLNDYMTPETLAGRIVSMGNGSPDVEQIRQFLSRSNLVRLVAAQEQGYRLSEKGRQVVEGTVNENYKNKNVITLRWVFENMTVMLLTTFVTFISVVFGLGFKLGKSF